MQLKVVFPGPIRGCCSGSLERDIEWEENKIANELFAVGGE